MPTRLDVPKMLLTDWMDVKGFTINEKWGDPYKMDRVLIYRLVALRAFIRSKIYKDANIVIHCGYEERKLGGYHPMGMAVDCHCTGISLMDFYLSAERFQFGGIGVYPNWNNPGLHLDIRVITQDEPAARWGCKEKEKYVELDSYFLKNIYGS